MSDRIQRWFARLGRDLTKVQTTDITQALRLLERAAEAAQLTLPDGYPAGSGERVSGGPGSNPTLGAAVHRLSAYEGERTNHRGELVEFGLTAIRSQIRVIEGALDAIHAELTKMVAPLESDPTRGPQPGSGYCCACLRWVSGVANDRLRSGFCSADHRRWLRAERPDRARFIRSVQVDLGIVEADDATESIVELDENGRPPRRRVTRSA